MYKSKTCIYNYQHKHTGKNKILQQQVTLSETKIAIYSYSLLLFYIINLLIIMWPEKYLLNFFGTVRRFRFIVTLLIGVCLYIWLIQFQIVMKSNLVKVQFHRNIKLILCLKGTLSKHKVSFKIWWFLLCYIIIDIMGTMWLKCIKFKKS
jgi:hypothetical protein